VLMKTFEWYRIVNPKPDDETVTKRTSAAQALIKRIDDDDDYDLLVGCATGVVNGFESGFGQSSQIVDVIVAAIRASQSAFPSDLKENALELRALAGIAVGEILVRSSGKPNDDAVLAASVIITGQGLRPRPQERFLAIVLDELNGAAQQVIDLAAGVVRQRIPLDLAELSAVEPGTTVATLWVELRPALENLFRHLDEQSASDREELQVLSWLYNNYSTKRGKPLASLEQYEVALCAGAEVADLVKVPTLKGIQNMVVDAVSRTINEKITDIPLIDIARQWTRDGMTSLLPKNTGVQAIVRQFPPLFPLTWLVMRLLESEGHPGWEKEFSLRTGLDAAVNHNPSQIATQVLNERVAQRIYANNVTNLANEE
jgi:hypothetical protein